MEIREYKPEDFEELANLNFELSKLEKDWLNLNPELLTLENIKKFVKEEIDEGKVKFFVCEVDGKIVGFINGEPKERDEWFKDRKYYYIDDVYTIPEFRKKGIGKALMEKLETYAKEQGFKEVVLNVSQKNEKVLEFYKKQGYKIKEYMFNKELN